MSRGSPGRERTAAQNPCQSGGGPPQGADPRSPPPLGGVYYFPSSFASPFFSGCTWAMLALRLSQKDQPGSGPDSCASSLAIPRANVWARHCACPRMEGDDSLNSQSPPMTETSRRHASTRCVSSIHQVVHNDHSVGYASRKASSVGQVPLSASCRAR